MKVYRCIRQFMCTPLKRYLPVGALVARYENATKIVIQDAPRSDLDVLFNVLSDGFEYVDPSLVTWIYTVEPPPLGTSTGFFALVESREEDDYGNVSATEDGLPTTSTLKVRTSDGMPFMQSATNGLWYPMRFVGVDGHVTLEIGQVGISSV